MTRGCFWFISRHAPLTGILLVLWVGPAFAQGEPAPGMQSLEFLSDQDVHALAAEKSLNPASAEKPAGNAEAKNRPPEQKAIDPALMPKTLVLIPDDPAPTATLNAPSSPEEGSTANTSATLPSFPPIKELRPWPLRPKTYAAVSNPAARAALLRDFEKKPGQAAPADLLMLATLYAADGNKTRAATLYYVAQLRHTFDVARFPHIKGPPFTPSPEVETIGAWAVASSDRLRGVITDVATFEDRTPYAYLPEALARSGKAREETDFPAESEWPDLLVKTRTSFLDHMNETADALARMGR